MVWREQELVDSENPQWLAEMKKKGQPGDWRQSWAISLEEGRKGQGKKFSPGENEELIQLCFSPL